MGHVVEASPESTGFHCVFSSERPGKGALGSLSGAARRAEVLPGHVHRSPATSGGTAQSPDQPCWALPLAALAGLRAVIVPSLRCSE